MPQVVRIVLAPLDAERKAAMQIEWREARRKAGMHISFEEYVVCRLGVAEGVSEEVVAAVKASVNERLAARRYLPDCSRNPTQKEVRAMRRRGGARAGGLVR